MPRTRLVSTALVLLAALALAAGCSRDEGRSENSPATPRSVLLIGLDGFEWKVAREMLADGGLPNLARLMRDGVSGELASTRPTLSPIIWTSIATGVSGKRHGINGFVKADSEGEQRLYTSRDRRAKALWNIVGDAGRSSTTVGWWNTFPVEQIRGVMVAQVNTISPKMRRAGAGIWKGKLVRELDGQIYPPELEQRVLAIVPEVEAAVDDLVTDILGELPELPDDMARGYLQQSRWAFRADSIYHRVGIELLRSEPPSDLFSIYFGGADVVGHRFWRYSYPDLYRHPPSDAEVAALGHVLERYYGYLDSIVGELVEAAPEGTDVLIVSDHGMRPVNRSARYSRPTLSGGHLSTPPAFFVAAGPRIRNSRDPAVTTGTRQPGSLGSILDIAPTVLALLDVAVGRDMEGEVITDVIDPGWLGDHPVQFVSTHTDEAWLADRDSSSPEVRGQVERLEQLRSLGYIE